MELLKRSLFCFFCFLSSALIARPTVTITSPDGKIKVWLTTDKSGLYYKVSYKGTLMMDVSRMKLSFKEGGAFRENLAILQAKPERLTEDYELINRKSKQSSQ